MQIKVKYFGQIAELTDREDEIFSFESGLTIGDLRQRILAEYETLNTINFRMSLNKEIVESETIISENDEIGMLPPFAGG